jgi:ketosteroid isomerase-like protein
VNTETNRRAVTAAFERLQQDGDMRPLFAIVDPQVKWTVIGSTWVSGEYRSLDEFRQIVRRIGARVAGPIAATVGRIIADGDMVVVLWDGHATTHEGMAYDNRYAWAMRFEGDRIVEVTAYIDTDLMARIAPPADS